MILNNFENVKPIYKVYESVFTEAECDQILEKQIGSSITLTNQDNEICKNYIDKSYNFFTYEITELSEEIEFYETRLMNYVLDANARIFGYNIWGVEKPPFLLTFKPGYSYGKHEDLLRYSLEPNDRKFSVYAFINNDDPNIPVAKIHFEQDDNVVEGKKGSVIIFPSFLTYSIESSKIALRQLLHCHIIGPKFR